ncbi:hypothetical protein TX23_01125 [Pseudomonas paralactis]|uniref:Uncharacterized protein n=1 Tax=Pseudomonas paralactis TaxID=1615673 RepID=A0A0R3API1_9PSED|nr:hypothetical protein TX23_01125 [Pseudomonas paralactis]
MTVVKALNLASYGCQLLALFLATRIDLKAFALAKASSELPDTVYADQYLAAKEGKQHFPSEAELVRKRRIWHRLAGCLAQGVCLRSAGFLRIFGTAMVSLRFGFRWPRKLCI